jgi:tetratricopeptide (TPR) repeat protein
MKVKFSFILLILGAVFLQSALADEYDDIANPEDKILVQQAIKHLSFEKRTLDVFQENDAIVKKIFKGHEENAAYLFVELGNYYLKAKDSSRASSSYIKAFEYSPVYEDLVSFLYGIGVSEGKYQDFNELSKVTQQIISR